MKKLKKFLGRVNTEIMTAAAGMNTPEAKKYSRKIRAVSSVLTMVILTGMFAVSVFADNAGADTSIANNSTFGTVKGLLQNALAVLGGGLIVWGVVQLGMSFQSEDGEKKTKAIQTMVGGVIVCVAAGLVTALMKDSVGGGAGNSGG